MLTMWQHLTLTLMTIVGTVYFGGNTGFAVHAAGEDGSAPAVGDFQWDPNGYVMFCLCMGNTSLST